MAAAPVQADEVASATVEGECNYGDQGASDSASVAVSEEGPSADGPNEDKVEEGVSACQSAAENGETPDEGSKLAVTVTVDGESQTVSTVTVTDELP